MNSMTMTPDRWRAIKSVFDDALEQPRDTRAQWIDSATAGDPELRAEVASLLTALEEEDGRFERMAGISLNHLVLDGDTSFPDGDDHIGAYRLIRAVGQGGMGVVFEAYRDDDQYRKRVAIKTISRGRDSDLILRRFRYERQILARLEHPNIAALYDGGVTQSGQPYFALEYVEGKPIDGYCDDAKLDVRARLQLFRQVCDAVAYAHRSLVIHRDLKPNNILVTEDGTVKLLDFGIAKLLDEDEDALSGLTQTGSILLTSAYASPEQVRGESVTTATDVFSLGLVLYKLLAGRHPFAEGGESGEEVRRRIREEDPRPPSGAPTTNAGRRTLRGDLDSIVQMALRKEPARRYSSVDQLSTDIHNYLAGFPVIAQPDSVGYRVKKFAKRNRAAVSSGAVAVLALTIGLAATAWQAEAARRERDRAQREAEKASHISRFLQEMFRTADPRSERKDITVAEALGLARQRALTELRARPEVLAGVLSSIGRTYLGLGRYDEADNALRRALILERSLDDGTRIGVTQALRDLASLEAERGNIAKAEPLLSEALGRARHPPVDSVLLGRLLDGSGSLQLDKGDFAGAERTLREAVALRRRVLGEQHEDVATSLNNLAVSIGQQNRWAEAIPLHQQALAVVRSLKGPEHPDVATAINTLANAVTITGDYKAADTLFQRTLELRQRLLGAHHPEVAWTHYSYADMLRLAGDYPRAIAEASAVLAERGTSLPETHPMIHSALQVFGRSHLALGHVREAEAALRESLRLRKAAYPADHWLVASATGAVGESLLFGKRYGEAEPMLLGAYTELNKSKGKTDQRTRDLAAALVKLYEAMGQKSKADAYR